METQSNTTQRQEQEMFQRFGQSILQNTANTLNTGEEGQLEDHLLPFDAELCLLREINDGIEGFQRHSSVLRNSPYQESLSRILASLRSETISPEEIQRMERIRHLCWEYARDINSGAYNTYHLVHKFGFCDETNQSALPIGVRRSNHQNAERELRRISAIIPSAENITDLIQQVASVEENFLYAAERGPSFEEREYSLRHPNERIGPRK